MVFRNKYKKIKKRLVSSEKGCRFAPRNTLYVYRKVLESIVVIGLVKKIKF
jgi:hypothetical protein